MQKRKLGSTGPEVSALGVGCMAMSGVYGSTDDAESIATIHAALDAGVTLFDTGDFYGMGHNEMLLGQALRGKRREDVFICVKFGSRRGPDGAMLGMDTSPAAVKNFLSYSLRRLGTDYVDLYQPARVDPNVPIEETVGAIADMVQAGYVRHIGLSEAGVDTIRRAYAVHPIAALQIEYSLLSRGIEATILPTVRELGIAIVAYGVLSRGLLGGSVAGNRAGAPGDFRMHLPRFRQENLASNLSLVDALHKIAQEKGVSVAQLAIAWVYSRGADIVPLIGVKRRDQLTSALGALDIALSATDLDWIEHAIPASAVAGDRYGHEQMATLDSERDGSSS